MSTYSIQTLIAYAKNEAVGVEANESIETVVSAYANAKAIHDRTIKEALQQIQNSYELMAKCKSAEERLLSNNKNLLPLALALGMCKKDSVPHELR